MVSKLRVFALVAAVLLAMVAAPGTARADGPAVEIQGVNRIGTWHDAVVTGLEGEVDYTWTIDGEPVTQTTLPNGSPISADRFFAFDEYLGKELALSVVVTPALGEPVTLTDGPYEIVTGPMIANNPTVSGEMRVGQTLTANHNILYPNDGLEISYQWFWGGPSLPVAGATGPTIVLTPDMVDKWGLGVQVIGSKDGWVTTTKISSLGRNILAKDVPAPTLMLSESPFVGVEVAVHVGFGSGTGDVTETYEWLLDGVVVKGQGMNSVVPAPSWAGKALQARVTLTRANGQSSSSTTPKQIVSPGWILDTRGMYSTHVAPGWLLKVQDAPLPAGTTQKFEWLRIDERGNETVIAGQNGSWYRMTEDDVGYKVGVRMSTNAPGHVDGVKTAVTRIPVAFNVYTTPGEHSHNGRQWRTTCEPYSQTIRCRTEIWATQVKRVGNSYVRETGWAFNNLAYLPLSHGKWGANPLATPGEWTDADGRGWRTDCGMPNVGHDTCRTWLQTQVVSAESVGGKWRYSTKTDWVFNNIVYTS